MKISEFELISLLRSKLNRGASDLLRGIGDDCAIIRKDKSSVWLLSTDCMVEDVHFSLNKFSYYELGRKCLAVNLSDIAAMAGKPRFVLVSLGIPQYVNENHLLQFYDGMQCLADQFAVRIIGGNLSKCPSAFFVNLTVIGEARLNECKMRSSAAKGDGIYLSGSIGTSAVGLAKLRQRRFSNRDLYIKAHKNPSPQVELGLILAKMPEVHALIDTSDGLIQDLKHILEESHVGAQIQVESLPRAKNFGETCSKLDLHPESVLLSGGEDYQLLFTMNPSAESKLQKKLASKKISVTRIGTIISSHKMGNRLTILHEGAELNRRFRGFDHFAKNANEKRSGERP